jgi:hypothetical protein
MTGEKPKEQPDKDKTKRVELALLHNHAYFVMEILDMRGLFSVALKVSENMSLNIRSFDFK